MSEFDILSKKKFTPLVFQRISEIGNKLKLQSSPRMTSSTQFIYLLSLSGSFFLMLYLSQQFFVEDFSIFRFCISDQGDPLLNPGGDIIFNTGVILFGFLQLPIYIYFYKHLLQSHPVIAKIAFAYYLISSLGMINVGIFPVYERTLHWIAAILTFFGFFFGANLSLLCLFRPKGGALHYSLNEDKIKMIVVSILLDVEFIIMIISMILKKKTAFPHENLPLWLQFSFWEWLFLLFTLLWMMEFSFLIWKSKSAKKID